MYYDENLFIEQAIHASLQDDHLNKDDELEFDKILN